MSPITTPETELAFRQYGATLEIKDAAKAALAAFKHACWNRDDVAPKLFDAMNDALEALKKLLEITQEEVVRLRPEKTIEERGYSLAERGMRDFDSGAGCKCGDGDGCGGAGCGGGGGCGSGGCNP